jgi:hypothetical protein
VGAEEYWNFSFFAIIIVGTSRIEHA